MLIGVIQQLVIAYPADAGGNDDWGETSGSKPAAKAAEAKKSPDAPSKCSLSAEAKRRRDQAIHYLHNKNRYELGMKQLREVVKDPCAASDWKTQHNLAKYAKQELYLEEAFTAARNAIAATGIPSNKRKSEAILGELEKFFGSVTLTLDGRSPVKEGIIILDVDEPIINKQKKEQFRAIKGRFEKTRVKLPLTIYLPFGEYKANLIPFKTEAGAQNAATIMLQGAGLVEQTPWGNLGLAAGFLLLIGLGLGPRLAGPDGQGIR